MVLRSEEENREASAINTDPSELGGDCTPVKPSEAHFPLRVENTGVTEPEESRKTSDKDG